MINSTIIIILSLILVLPAQAQFQNKEDVKKLMSAMKIINYAYVDSVDNSKLTEAAIEAALKELDPHSNYFTKEEIQKANEPLEGNFEGVGIQFQIYEDTILVVAPIPGGPSDDVGIRAGDKIVKINGEDATGEDINNKYVQNHLRGKKGTKVEVSVKRSGRDELIKFTITRDKIPLNSVEASYMLTDKIGTVKISRFSKTTLNEFKEAMKELKEEGMEELILDLRGNPGGYLQTATDLADEFIENGKLLVYTEGRKAPRRELKATSRGSFENGKLVVLINEGSASASEIVSGAVQDWDRGLVVGRRSFGKGLVQRPFTLPDSSVIRLTTARYHTPSGRCIQRPYEEGEKEEYYKDIRERMERGEFVNSDSITFPDTLKYSTDNGRTVYGGGGIMPDVFVPWDSTRFSDFYTNIVKNRIPNSYILDYLDEERGELKKKYDNVKSFKSRYTITDEFMNEFIDYTKDEGVEFDEEGYQQSEKQIKHMLKALIARNLFDISAYYEIISMIDQTIQKSVEILKEETAFNEKKIEY
ncbi:MAG: S41 family peptidase [Bacteroidales bacterium]|nr:S41 family peptidase [Bacteroidales bacterium]